MKSIKIYYRSLRELINYAKRLSTVPSWEPVYVTQPAVNKGVGNAQMAIRH